MSINQNKVLLVGCGAMGSALLQGWILSDDKEASISIVAPHESSVQPYYQDININWYPDPGSIPVDYKPDAIIFAVKPQILGEVLEAYRKFTNSLFISIAAGKKLEFLASHLGDDAAIVRIMPNLPSAFGKGVAVGIADSNVAQNQKALSHDLFSAVGQFDWVADEKLFDAITAVSGSGPAYFYLLVECLAQAGKEVGLPADLAAMLARQTMIGASAMSENSQDSAALLKSRVASPGGVTEAALEVLEATDSGLPNLLARAIKVATAKSQKLSR